MYAARIKRRFRKRSGNIRRKHNKMESSSSTFLGEDKSLNKRLRELYPTVKEHEVDISLPRRWDRNQASSFLDISKNGLCVTFKKHAKVKDEKEMSAVVRANSPIPASCGLYYFEVTIVHGHRGCMGVGISRKDGQLNRMPGWDPDCYGYHGDDGNFFSACGHGSSYGPKFGTGDVVGCGVDTLLQHIFFTKNGQYLGMRPEKIDMTRDMYPTVGLKTPGEQLIVNFGQQPFVFDITKHQKYLTKEKNVKIEQTPMPDDMPIILNRIVSSFLATNGAVETLKAFEDMRDVERTEDYGFIAKRAEIMKMIIKGSHGIKVEMKINSYFPRLLDKHPDVHVLIMCMRFIDVSCSIIAQPQDFREYAHSVASESTSSLSIPMLSNPNKRRSSGDKNSPSKKSSSVSRKDDSDSDEEMDDPKLVKLDKNIHASKQMYVQLHDTKELDKMKYMINMGRQIVKASDCIKVCSKTREIIELSLATTYSLRKPRDVHPFTQSHRQFIANRVYKMLSGSEQKPFSELRGLFYGWKGLHLDMASKDLQAASYSDAKHLIIDDDIDSDCASEMSSRNESPKVDLDEDMPLI